VQPTDDATPLEDLIEEFRCHNEAANLSLNTVRWYDDLLAAYLRWLAGHGVARTLAAFTLARCEAYVRDLRARPHPRTGRPLSMHTVHAHVRVLKVFAGFLGARGYSAGNVLAGLRYPRTRPPEIRPLSDEEMLRLLRAAGEDGRFAFRNHCIVAAFLDTGLRLSELACLRLDDADLEEGFLTVTGKGDRRRRVPLSPPVRGLLVRYRDRYRPGALPYPDETFFRNDRGGDMTANAVTLVVKRLAARAGIPRLHPHLLRHTFASAALRQGEDVETLRRILGHRDYRQLQAYVHLADEDLLARHRSPIQRLLTQHRAPLLPAPRDRRRRNPAPDASPAGGGGNDRRPGRGRAASPSPPPGSTPAPPAADR
jgi:site-specific recombinase XerD